MEYSDYPYPVAVYIQPARPRHDETPVESAAAGIPCVIRTDRISADFSVAEITRMGLSPGTPLSIALCVSTVTEDGGDGIGAFVHREGTVLSLEKAPDGDRLLMRIGVVPSHGIPDQILEAVVASGEVLK